MTKKYAKAQKRDENEPLIVAALQEIGADVEYADFTDLVVGYDRENFLLEVKNPHAASGGRDIEHRKKQKAKRDAWTGGIWEEVWTIYDAFCVLHGELRENHILPRIKGERKL